MIPGFYHFDVRADNSIRTDIEVVDLMKAAVIKGFDVRTGVVNECSRRRISIG